MNGDVIESILTDTGLVSPFTNGSDLLFPLVLSDCTIFNLQFGFSFSDPSYINGQSYKFEFTSNIDDLFISSYIPLENVAAIVSVDYALSRAIDQFEIGDSFSEITLYRHAFGYLNGIDSDIDCRYSEHTNRFSLEFTFSDNYTFNELNSQNSNNIDLAFLIVMRNDSANQISFNDVTFSPVGSTKQLYADELFQNGILNGLEDVEDELSDVNDKLEDVIGSDEEGSESGIKGILQKIKVLPSALIEGIKNLFIPSEEDIENFKNNFDQLLSDHLGVLWQAPNLLIDFIQMMADFEPIRSDDFGDYYLEYPVKSVYINSDADDTLDILSETDNGGVLIPLVPANNDSGTYVISFDWLGKAPFSTFYGIYKVAFIFVCCIGFCYFCLRKYNKLMGE